MVTFIKFTVFVLSAVTYVTCKDCTLDDECSCTFTDGSGKVDLTSLGKTDQTPRFKDVVYQDEGYYYSYNPCKGFTEGDCKDAAVCVSNQAKSEQQQIGDASNAAFKYDDEGGNVIVAYTSGHGVLRLSTVDLVCKPSACTPIFEPKGEQGPGQFEMTLTTVCACPGMCTSNGPKSCSSGSGGLSGGSILLIAYVHLLFIMLTRSGRLSVNGIFLIAFFSFMLIYLIAGVLFMKIRKQATGTDLIPNKSLWASIPGLVVAGNKFVVSKVTKKPMVYDKI